MYQCLSPKVEGLPGPGYFPMRLDRGTREQISKLSSRQKEMIYYSSSPPTNQFPAWPRSLNPQCLAILPYILCKLPVMGSSGFGAPVCWSPGWRLHCSFPFLVFGCQCRVDELFLFYNTWEPHSASSSHSFELYLWASVLYLHLPSMSVIKVCSKVIRKVQENL